MSFTRHRARTDLPDPHKRNVLSGQLIEEMDALAPQVDAARTENIDASDDATPPVTRARPKPKTKRPSTLPAMVQPQLATLVNSVPGERKAWLAEIKFDGYRMLARIEDGEVRLFSRNGKDWSARLPEIAAAIAQLPLQNGWLDGELVATLNDGSMSFQALQNAFSDPLPEGQARPQLRFYIFDLPFMNNADLRLQPLLNRKKKLAKLFKTIPDHSPLHFSDHLQTDLAEAFAHACRHGLEGLMFKRVDSVYQEKRNRDWLKLKCQQRQEFVIGGYTDPAGSRIGFGALLLGVYDDDGKLHYAGRVGTGFDDAMLKTLAAQLAQTPRKSSPFEEDVPPRERAHVHWVEPRQVAEIRFAEWTEEKRLRQAAFLGLREDKPAQAVVPEMPVTPPQPTRGKLKETPVTVAGVGITHPSRIVFPRTGDTKLAIAQYYEAVADWLIPQLKNRPLTLVRCPQGAAHACFFQKHLTDTLPQGLQPVEIEDSKGTATYMIANDLHAALVLVQSGVLELHTWGSTQQRLESPDRIIFDLDPAPDVSWAKVVDAAQLLRGVLVDAGLPVFLKTTGGKGLHIEVPLRPGPEWDVVHRFSKAVAEQMAQQWPDRFIATMSKAKRNGKIFLDYLRNARGATAVAAYSTRARDQASVATPISWEELPTLESASFWTIHTLPQRLAEGVDPWVGYDAGRVRLGEGFMQRFGVE